MKEFAITQHIPVSKHVYKYLVATVGSENYEVNRWDSLGAIILSLLGKTPGDLRLSKKDHEKVFNIKISSHHYLASGMFIDIKSGQLFNRLIDNLFRENMYTYVVLVKKYHSEKYTEGIKEYCKAFNINEDDIKLETLFKDFGRKKDKYLSQIQ